MKKIYRFPGSTARLTACFTALVVCAGCATTVNFQVQRPPTLNTLGIQRLAVMPFSTTDDSPPQKQAAAFLMSEALARVQATHHFTLVNSAEIERVRAARGNIETLADALLSGQVLAATVNDSEETVVYKIDGKTQTVTHYTRKAELVFNYGLTRTRDGSIIGPLTKNRSISDTNDNQANLDTAENLIQKIVQRAMAEAGRDVAPYTTIERRTLMKETSRDKMIKQRAKDADALVKAGNYKNAHNAFLEIYQDTGSFAAAYNTALLIEVQGDLEGAMAFMRQVHNKTGNPKAAAETARLQRVMDNVALVAAYTVNQTRRDRIITLMTETLPSKIPEHAQVAFINNSRNEKELAEIIINGVIDGFVSKNITVIDRSNRLLTEMEKNYQYSGNVSDEAMVRIGHEAGVNTFILVAVTGSGGSRRLSVRALDVERNTILYQSPPTDAMNL